MRKKRLKLVDNDVAAALDRTQTSDRAAAYILQKTVQRTAQATAEAFGKDDGQFVLETAVSRSTIRRNRIKNRDESASTLKETLSGKVHLLFIGMESRFLIN